MAWGWRGVNSPPLSTLPHPILTHLDALASQASLADAASYGAGLRKFHLFCDIFSIPESARLPASLPVLKSFALWSITDPDPEDPVLADGTPFEPISVVAVRKYLSAVRAWHLAQGWPPPLSEEELTQLNWSLRGLDRLQANRRKRPPRPPVTLHMLTTLRSSLRLNDPFDAAVWAAATCSFWGMMRFGEVSVTSRAAFSGDRHLSDERINRLCGCFLHSFVHRRPTPRVTFANEDQVKVMTTTPKQASELGDDEISFFVTVALFVYHNHIH